MSPIDSTQRPIIDADDVKRDIDVLLWSMRLQWVRRYYRQQFWEKEATAASFAELVEPFPRLETVAEHSWHVADCTLLLADHFPELDPDHCVVLALLHDKLEIVTGDPSLVGRDGMGQKTHAFNPERRFSKVERERYALKTYLV